MEFTTTVMDTFAKFEEDSAVLKGLRERANDLGYVTVNEALDVLSETQE